jgi:hypothetical protein
MSGTCTSAFDVILQPASDLSQLAAQLVVIMNVRYVRQLFFLAVVRIRIHRIHVFLGLLDPDPDPLVRGMDPDQNSDPDPSIIKQKW